MRESEQPTVQTFDKDVPRLLLHFYNHPPDINDRKAYISWFTDVIAYAQIALHGATTKKSVRLDEELEALKKHCESLASQSVLSKDMDAHGKKSEPSRSGEMPKDDEYIKKAQELLRKVLEKI